MGSRMRACRLLPGAEPSGVHKWRAPFSGVFHAAVPLFLLPWLPKFQTEKTHLKLVDGLLDWHLLTFPQLVRIRNFGFCFQLFLSSHL